MGRQVGGGTHPTIAGARSAVHTLSVGTGAVHMVSMTEQGPRGAGWLPRTWTTGIRRLVGLGPRFAWLTGSSWAGPCWGSRHGAPRVGGEPEGVKASEPHAWSPGTGGFSPCRTSEAGSDWRPGRVPCAAQFAAEGQAGRSGAQSSRNARRLGPRTGARGLCTRTQQADKQGEQNPESHQADSLMFNQTVPIQASCFSIRRAP